MHFLTLVTVLTAAVLVAATPLHKRALGGILICTGANATGECTHDVYALDTCTNLTAPYYQHAATFAPDGEAFYCYPYLVPCGGACRSPEGCTYGAVSYNTTAKFDLAAAGGWDRYISSFECHAGPAPGGTPVVVP